MPSTLGELASALERASRDVETRAARECAGEAGHAFLVQLRLETPVLTGELRASEREDSLRGSGTSAVVTIGAHTVYAEFRNDGGTITVKNAKVLGTPAVGFFGRSVTQTGNHYFERAEARAGPEIEAACRRVIQKMLTDAGL